MVAPALGTVALELKGMLGNTWKSPHVGKLATVAVLIPLVLTSVFHLRPDFEVQLMEALPANLRTKLQSSPKSESWFFWPETAHAGTTGPAGGQGSSANDHPVEPRRGAP